MFRAIGFAAILLGVALGLANAAFAAKAKHAAPAATTTVSEAEQAMTILNAYRAAQGRSALRLDAKLTGVADRLAYACAQAEGVCDHTTGGSFTARLRAAGYRAGYGAENLRKNVPTITAAFDWWKSSQIHSANMLIKQLKAAGFAHRASPKGRHFWVLVLAD